MSTSNKTKKAHLNNLQKNQNKKESKNTAVLSNEQKVKEIRNYITNMSERL